MVVANLTKELKSVKDKPIQQCRASIAELMDSIQESNPKINMVRQEENPCQQRKSESDARIGLWSLPRKATNKEPPKITMTGSVSRLRKARRTSMVRKLVRRMKHGQVISPIFTVQLCPQSRPKSEQTQKACVGLHGRHRNQNDKKGEQGKRSNPRKNQ